MTDDKPVGGNGRSDRLEQQLSQVSTLLTQTATKLDGTNQLISSHALRMDRAEQQRDHDRNEILVVARELTGITATCKLHIERTAAAESAALAAAKDAAIAARTSEDTRNRVQAIESSWNVIQRRPGSAEYKTVTAGVEQRAQTRAEEQTELEERVAQKTAEAIKEQMRIRDEAKKDALAEQERIEVVAKRLKTEAEEERQVPLREAAARTAARRKAIEWAVGLVVGTFIAAGGTGLITLWSQARANQEQAKTNQVETAKTLKKVEQVQEVILKKKNVVALPLPIPVLVPIKKGP